MTKRITKQICSFLFSFLFLLFSVSAYAVEETPLYEKYDYQENFEYDDVIIGYALKATVPKIILEYNATLRYNPVQFDSARLSAQFEDLCVEFAEIYTEEEIAEKLIDYMRENISDYLVYGDSKTIDVSGAGSGSGVVISDDGYIATNAHVASLNEDSKLQLYMYSLYDNIYEDMYDIINELEQYGIELDYEESDYIYSLISSAATEGAELIDEKSVLKVCFPTSDGNTAYDDAVTYVAKLVDIGTQEGLDGLTQDTAILKINETNLVSLSLSPSYPESNSMIVTAGYPAVADEIFSGAGSDASVVSVSIVTGKVSRLVPIDGTSYKSIEITSTISNGNSGGPSVDKHLQIEGLNTYSAFSDMRYAYMVSSEFVSSLISGNDAKQGETTKVFLTGLQMLQQDYGASAKECFEYVRMLQPDTPYIEEMIETAEKAPQNSYVSTNSTQTQKQIPEKKDNNLLLYLICGGALILLIIIVLLVILIKKKNEHKAETISSHTYHSAGYSEPPQESYPPMPADNSYNPMTHQHQQPVQDTWDDVTFNNADNADRAFATSVPADIENSYAQQPVYYDENIQQMPIIQDFPQETAPAPQTIPEFVAPEFDAPAAPEAPTPNSPMAEASGSRIKSTMRKAEPKETASSAAPDEHFHAPTEL